MNEQFTPNTLGKRLSLERARIQAQIQKTKPGPQQDLLCRKLLEIEWRSKLLNGWVSSRELQPSE
jgi:hypothetical protein